MFAIPKSILMHPQGASNEVLALFNLSSIFFDGESGIRNPSVMYGQLAETE
jgi:hypothetical protein